MTSENDAKQVAKRQQATSQEDVQNRQHNRGNRNATPTHESSKAGNFMARSASRYLHGERMTRNNHLNGQNQRKINITRDDAIIIIFYQNTYLN